MIYRYIDRYTYMRRCGLLCHSHMHAFTHQSPMLCLSLALPLEERYVPIYVMTLNRPRVRVIADPMVFCLLSSTCCGTRSWNEMLKQVIFCAPRVTGCGIGLRWQGGVRVYLPTYMLQAIWREGGQEKITEDTAGAAGSSRRVADRTLPEPWRCPAVFRISIEWMSIRYEVPVVPCTYSCFCFITA